MSRVGKKPLEVPSVVELTIAGDQITVKGPKGQVAMKTHPHVTVAKEGTVVTVAVKDELDVKDRALWGLTRRLLENMVVGVTAGFEKKLEVNGVGFKVAMQGRDLKLDVGFSHDIIFKLPEGVNASVDKNVITVSGIDKHLVGETAAQIRRIRKPEPYKGKGIKYLDEEIRRKAGKAAKAAA